MIGLGTQGLLIHARIKNADLVGGRSVKTVEIRSGRLAIGKYLGRPRLTVARGQIKVAPLQERVRLGKVFVTEIMHGHQRLAREQEGQRMCWNEGQIRSSLPQLHGQVQVRPAAPPWQDDLLDIRRTRKKIRQRSIAKIERDLMWIALCVIELEQRLNQTPRIILCASRTIDCCTAGVDRDV